MVYEEDFRCPYCKKEGKVIMGFDKYYSPEWYKMIYCKRHEFIFFEKRDYGNFLSVNYKWISRKADNADFRCGDCIHWNINKYSEEDENKLSKACDLNIPLPDNPNYNPENKFRMAHTTACKKFKHKEAR